MFTEKNFKIALKFMNFIETSRDIFLKNFAENISMQVDFNQKNFFYPKNLKVHRDSAKNFSQNENFVVFECVNRLLEKGYRPEDIEIEKSWQLGHLQKSGRADICVSHDEKILFIIECKTFGAEFNEELKNLKSNGGQLFSYWQQENSCQWLVLYSSTFDNEKFNYSFASVSCNEKIYKNANTVTEKFKIWSEDYHKQIADDVIFHNETSAYKIGVKPFRKKNLQDFDDTGVVNKFEEILRHNSVTNKQNAFDALLELFICKLVDESDKNFDDEVEFQFKFGADTQENFIDRLQKLYHQGMEKFMQIPTTYTPLSVVENILKQNRGENRKVLENIFKEEFNKLKFYTPNIFNFIKVLNREIFYMNCKVVAEVVEAFKNYRIIGAKNLQTLGDMFEQLLDKGFKQDEGQFFTPLPITKFIWNCLPIEKFFISKNPPKIIDYACGSGHFLTQGFEIINNFMQNNLPVGWEDKKIFGIEKNDRLSLVSKISMFMHGANKATIKFGDGLENYPAEGISPETFDILVSNPPYSVKDFKQHLKLKNNFKTLEKITKNGSEIETLFSERISQLLKPGGIAAVILPSSILNKDGKSFITARENILQNFYIRAIAEFGSKTFSATGTKTNILFLEKISNPQKKFDLFLDTVNGIFLNLDEWDNEEIFSAWIFKNNLDKKIFQKFIGREKAFFEWKNDAYFGEYYQKFVDMTRPARDFIEKYGKIIFVRQKFSENNFCTAKIPEQENLNRKFYNFAHEIEREKIQYFAQTYTQTTLIISAPDENSAQEKFLGYKWSNRKGDEGIKITGEGYLTKLSAAVKNIFSDRQIDIPDAKNFYNYHKLSDLIDFSGTNFSKIIKTVPQKNFEVKEGFKIFRLSSKDFEIFIGNRVLSTEIISDGEIPVYSANVFEEFGRINKKNIEDFSVPSIIWGIDGDWMVNLIPAEKIFYPTDHCGVLRIKTSEIIPEYFKFVLKVAGEHEKFSRTNRASIARIKNLSVQIASLEEQKKIVAEFAEVDEKISAQEKIISDGDAKIKNKFEEMFGSIEEKISIDECCEIKKGTNLTREQAVAGKIPVVAGGILPSCYHNVANREKNIITISASGNAGFVNFWREPIFATDCNTLKNKKNFVIEFIYFALKNIQEEIYKLRRGMAQQHVYADDIAKILIPNPPRDLQEKFAEFVAVVEGEKNSAIELKKILQVERESLVEKYFR